MANFKRTARLNEQLRQEISLVVRNEVRDPRTALATITSVEVSPELDHARVYVTALGDDTEREEVVQGLRSASAFIRSQLARRLHIRRIPELHFRVDRMLDEANRIEELLRQVRPELDDAPADPEADAGRPEGADADVAEASNGGDMEQDGPSADKQTGPAGRDTRESDAAGDTGPSAA